ncbi:MAG: DUF6456 domain-containing protein, partial [Xanthobacteraceae bacterium]
MSSAPGPPRNACAAPERVSSAGIPARSPCATARWSGPWRCKTITPEQYAAAQKYRHHWYFGGLHDHLGSLDLTRILAGHHGDYSGMARSENQAFHRQRFREAVQAIGKIGSHVLDSAVCREMPLEQVGYALGWGNR